MGHAGIGKPHSAALLMASPDCLLMHALCVKRTIDTMCPEYILKAIFHQCHSDSPFDTDASPGTALQQQRELLVALAGLMDPSSPAVTCRDCGALFDANGTSDGNTEKRANATRSRATTAEGFAAAPTSARTAMRSPRGWARKFLTPLVRLRRARSASAPEAGGLRRATGRRRRWGPRQASHRPRRFL